MLYSPHMFRLRHAKGFTILEILVVVAIVGILGAVAIYSLGVSRASTRDAKRISDVSVIRAALTQYWLQKASFPESDKVDLGKPGTNADKLTGNGFVSKDVGAQPVFLLQVPFGAKSGEYYQYQGAKEGYSLRFMTERETAYGPAGVWYAHADGVDQQDIVK
jgi:prepilin-type N-terminal cleavage/methylation domain-containing protein